MHFFGLLTFCLFFSGVDCGIFAVKFMELWDKNIDLRHMFDQSDIPNIRVKLAVDLFFSKGNSIDKSLVMNFYKQVLFAVHTTYLLCEYMFLLLLQFFCRALILVSVISFLVFCFGGFLNHKSLCN